MQPLLRFHAQFLERLGGVGAVLAGPHFLVDLHDLAVFADVERPPIWQATGGSYHAVCPGRFLGGIAQDRVIQFQRFGKVDVALGAFGRITTGREVSDVKFSQILAVRTERLALGRSATGKRLGVPGDHHGLFASVCRKLIRFAVTALQCKIRSGIADLQVRCAQNSGGKYCCEGESRFHYRLLGRSLATLCSICKR